MCEYIAYELNNKKNKKKRFERDIRCVRTYEYESDDIQTNKTQRYVSQINYL